MSRLFGHVAGVVMGATFESRAEVAASGVHTPTMQGISGNGESGVESIVASGGYVDDEDHGDVLIYTGMGGRDMKTGRQIADQTITHYANAGLVTSELAGYPVRVIRGSNGDPRYAPSSGFRYDGLFTVTAHWSKRGRDGYRIIQYRLERQAHQAPAAHGQAPDDDPAFATTTITRRIRSTAVSRHVKSLYDNVCQVCDNEVVIYGGVYAEGAHIRPLGSPHKGPDTADNILCLCPNHHVQLDLGGIFITPEYRVVNRETGDVLGPLRVVRGHAISLEHLKYQREMWPQQA